MGIFKKRKKLWIILILAVVLIASGAFFAAGKRNKPIEVQTDKVKRQDLVSKVTASGKIEPKKKVDISASIPGKIVRLAVEEGDSVRKGDFLLQIDPAPYQAELDNARAALRAAQSDLESAKATTLQLEQTFRRKEKMWKGKSGLISEDEYERSKTDFEVQQTRVRAAQHYVEQARANIDRAADNMNKTVATAPMSGIVVRRSVEEGEVAVIGTMNNPGTVLLTIADLSIMEAELEVDETDIGSLEIGQPAIVTVDAFPGKKFIGEVTEIGNSPILKGTGTNQEATDFKLTITLKSPVAQLRPGLTADGEVITAKRSKCLTVPIQALVIRDLTKDKEKSTQIPKEEREKEGVFWVQGTKAIFKPVKTGITGELEIEIVEGLREKEEIVTGSYQTLRDLKDGDAIVIKKETEKGKEEKKSR